VDGADTKRAFSGRSPPVVELRGGCRSLAVGFRGDVEPVYDCPGMPGSFLISRFWGLPVALALLSVACSADAGQERVAFAGPAQQVDELASSVAERMAEAGRSIARVETESPAEVQDRVAELLKSPADEGEKREPGRDEAAAQQERAIIDAVERATPTKSSSRADDEETPVERKTQGPGQDELSRAKGADRTDCLVYRQVARPLGFGYDHLVFLENQCEKRMRCTVTTDVNPEPVVEEVDPGQTGVALTFRGSPARVFNARVDCQPAQEISR
jgi:hypothetical protein